jgi:hypothetical protein
VPLFFDHRQQLGEGSAQEFGLQGNELVFDELVDERQHHLHLFRKAKVHGVS